jgi:hypothetical protein
MDIEIDNYPVSDLPQRFLIGKQALYNRLDALDLKPTRVGNRSFINATQLKLLDDLHEHLLAGKTMAEFTTSSPLDKVDESSGLVEYNPKILDLITAISKAVEMAIPQRSPLWYSIELEKAIAHGWWLTTGEIQQLIGVKPVAKTGKQTYQRGSFIFTKEGKVGSQIAWSVKKNSPTQSRGDNSPSS